MEQVDLGAVHTALIGFTKRAERATEESLVATFVDSAPLFALLSTENNQVIYGRRGTGKTHALKVLAEHVEQQKNGIPVFLDMRTIGSNGSIYADTSAHWWSGRRRCWAMHCPVY
jgi:Cdc6-like AAA superfamily ATPase